MKPLLLCTVLLVVAACASEESKPREIRAAMTAEAPVLQTSTPGPPSGAVAPAPAEIASASDPPALPPAPGAEASTVPPAVPTVPGTPPTSALGTPPPASSDTPTQPVATAAKSEPERQPPAAKPPTGPVITFFDSNVFDKRLSSSLRHGTDVVVVALETPSSVNDIPARLNKWLSAVEKYHGTVELQADPDYPAIVQRGLVAEAASLIFGAFTALYDAIVDKILYSPAKGYNTTVYYIKGSGVMTKVVFTRKPRQS